MSVCLITIGIGDWERWTFPLIQSVRQYEKDMPLLVIDNGADDPYPHYNGIDVARIDKTISYPAAMNYGIAVADSMYKPDYYVVINNDVLCHGKFVELVERQPKDVLAGNHLNSKYGRQWIDSWHWSIPRQVWELVGEFDENFKVCAFEDADYCFRAEGLGVYVLKSFQPFEHLAGRIRWTLDGYGEQRRKNIEYLMAKYPNLEKEGWNVW